MQGSCKFNLMEIAEIRIGNWYVDTFAGFNQVEARDFENWDAINALEIPINPELLNQFGFIGSESTWIKEKVFSGQCTQQMIIFHDADKHEYRVSVKTIYELDGRTDNLTLHVDINYIHQLQNLYFAFTGEELEISATVSPTVL